MTYTLADMEFELNCDFSLSIIFSYEKANEVIETISKLKSLSSEFEKISAAQAKALEEIREYTRCLDKETQC